VAGGTVQVRPCHSGGRVQTQVDHRPYIGTLVTDLWLWLRGDRYPSLIEIIFIVYVPWANVYCANPVSASQCAVTTRSSAVAVRADRTAYDVRYSLLAIYLLTYLLTYWQSIKPRFS